MPFKALSWLYASGSSQAVSLDCAFEDDPDLPLPMKHMLVFIVVPVVALAVLLLVQAGMWGWARLRQVGAWAEQHAVSCTWIVLRPSSV